MGIGIGREKESGFTLNELLVVVAVFGVISAVAVPAISHWFSQYGLRKAVRDLFGNMQLAKQGAVKENRRWRIAFFPEPPPGGYVVWSYGPNGKWNGGTGDDVEVKAVDMSQYGRGVCFGPGAAFQSATKPPGPLPGDGISYNHNAAVFSSRGTANTLGYVYLCNGDRSSFAVGATSLAGVVVIKHWTGARWE
jgi:prepilin-type N-terminal cleavage/methylation domain-containing protein